MGQFWRKLSQIKCSRSFNSCSKHMKLGRRVLQTLNHIHPTGFAFKLPGWNMRSTLSTWYRCESHPKPGTRTLLLVRMHVRCVFQTQFQNTPRSGSLDMGAMDFHTRSWGSADSGWLWKYLSKTQKLSRIWTRSNGSILEEIKSNKVFPCVPSIPVPTTWNSVGVSYRA